MLFCIIVWNFVYKLSLDLIFIYEIGNLCQTLEHLKFDYLKYQQLLYAMRNVQLNDYFVSLKDI